MDAITQLEIISGKPPYSVDIFKYLRNKKQKIHILQIKYTLPNLYRNGLFYADEYFNRFSVKGCGEEFLKFNERIKAKYPGFILD